METVRLESKTVNFGSGPTRHRILRGDLENPAHSGGRC